MALFNKESNEQKQKKKQAEIILDKKVGGLMPTAARRAFFKRMTNKGIKARRQERVRNQVLKIIKNEVENDELEPTEEAIDKRIEQILNENIDYGLVEKRIENHQADSQKVAVKKLNKTREIEEKFGVNLTNKQWFQCSIEEVKFSTFTNQAQRNIDTAYVIINEDSFEIIKESVWLKTNMGSRKLFFFNITSIDYDARGLLHASSSVIINTKSAEHVQLKFVTKDNFDLMNNSFESYLQKTHELPQTPQIEQHITTTSDADELLKYAELYEKGLLTKEEFETKKQQILNNEKALKEEFETQNIQSNETLLKEEYLNDDEFELKPKFCPNCGNSVDEDSKFCINCGNKL